MNMRHLFHSTLLAAALAMALPALAAKAGKGAVAPEAAKVCEGCHGAKGVATDPAVPHLNGQLSDNIIDSMDKFKQGKRPSSSPEHSNPALTEQDIDALAKYYAAQKAERPVQPVDAAKVAAAEPVYQRRCTKCHLDSGRDADHDAPLMAGQSLQYLQAQTTAFVTGKRKYPFLMDEAYQGLSKEDLERLSHYFASQKQ